MLMLLHLRKEQQRKLNRLTFLNLRLWRQSLKANSLMNLDDLFRRIDPLVLALKVENEGGRDEVERGVARPAEIEGTTTAEMIEESQDEMIGEMIEGTIGEMTEERIEGEMTAVEMTDEMIEDEMTDDAMIEGIDEMMMTDVIEEMTDMTEGGRKEDRESVLVLALLPMVADSTVLLLIRKDSPLAAASVILKADSRVLLRQLPVTLKVDSMELPVTHRVPRVGLTVLHRVDLTAHQVHFPIILKVALMAFIPKIDLMDLQSINHMDFLQITKGLPSVCQARFPILPKELGHDRVDSEIPNLLPLQVCCLPAGCPNNRRGSKCNHIRFLLKCQHNVYRHFKQTSQDLSIQI